MERPPPKKVPDESIEERRRARWNAFWTPFITLASIVISVALLMFFARTCRERFPQFSPQGSLAPLKSERSPSRPVEIFRPAKQESAGQESTRSRPGNNFDSERTTSRQ